MNNSFKHNLKTYFDDKRALATEKASLDFKTAMAIPEYKKLESARADLVISFARQQAESKDYSKTKALLDKCVALQQRILVSHNLSITPQFECRKCNDSGFLNDGSKCSCYKTAFSNLLKDVKNLGGIIPFTFDDNTLPTGSAMSNLFSKMEQFCNAFPDTKEHMILLSGRTGTGKTYLISAMANAVLEKGFTVIFTTAFELIALAKDYHYSFKENDDGFMRNLLDADLIVIDDLGAEPMIKNITIDYLFNIINSRLVNKKHLLLSTNLNGRELLEKYGERIFSRIMQKNNSIRIQLHADDLRLK